MIKLKFVKLNLSFPSLCKPGPPRLWHTQKPVVDLFRYRQSADKEEKSGLNIAIEGLREALRQRKATPAEIPMFGPASVLQDVALQKSERVPKHIECRTLHRRDIGVERVDVSLRQCNEMAAERTRVGRRRRQRTVLERVQFGVGLAMADIFRRGGNRGIRSSA